MTILPVTSEQQRFLLVDVLDFYLDDDDPTVRETAEVATDHLMREHGGGLPLYNVDALYDMILDRVNGIDDAIEEGKTEERYQWTPQQARGAQRSGTALLKKLNRHRHAPVHAPNAARRGVEPAVKAMQLYLGSVDFAGVRQQQRLYDRAMRAVEKVASAHGVPAHALWGEFEREALRRGAKRPVPGKDY